MFIGQIRECFFVEDLRFCAVISSRACSSAWLERTPDKGEVGSSSLPRPTTYMNESSIQKSKIFEIVKRSILNIEMTIILMMCART